MNSYSEIQILSSALTELSGSLKANNVACPVGLSFLPWLGIGLPVAQKPTPVGEHKGVGVGGEDLHLSNFRSVCGHERDPPKSATNPPEERTWNTT